MEGGLVVLFCDGLGDDHDDWEVGSLFLLVKCLPWLVEYGTMLRCGYWIYECFKSLDSTVVTISVYTRMILTMVDRGSPLLAMVDADACDGWKGKPLL